MKKHEDKRSKATHNRRTARLPKRKREMGQAAIAFGAADALLASGYGYWAYQGFVLHRHVHIPIVVIPATLVCLAMTGLTAYSWWKN